MIIPISIKSPEPEKSAKGLKDGKLSGRSMAEDLREIGTRCSNLPVISQLTEDEVLGYDEFGIPTR